MARKKPGFDAYVKRLEEYIDRERPEKLSVEQIAEVLGVSPNYARSVAKAVAQRRGYRYYWGVLYVI